MRKIIFSISVSLDGYFEGPNREIDWHRVDDGLLGYFNRELAPMSAFIDGRITYELMLDYWPTADAGPDVPAPVAEFARIWRDMPKIVYSRTLEHTQWNTEIRREVDPREIEELKSRPGGDMVIGGPDLAATFLRHGLIDEYRIYVHPVILGKGRAPFPPDVRKEDLQLLETRAVGNGVVLLRYR